MSFKLLFLLLCLPYMLPLVINLITWANTQLVTADWKNRANEKYNCLPQETFSCQKWNVWCICSSLRMSAPLKRHQSFMRAEHDAAAFPPLLCFSPPFFISTPGTPVCTGVLLSQPNCIFLWWSGVWQAYACCCLCTAHLMQRKQTKMQCWGFLQAVLC